MSDTDPSSGGAPPVLQRVAQGSGPPGTEGAVVTVAAALAAGLPYQAPLTRDPPLRLLYLAAAGSATGCLALETERGRFAIHVRRGILEHASSDVLDDALGRFLLSRGAVTPDALAQAERLRGEHAGDLVAALARTGAFNPATGFRLLQEHGGWVVTRAIAADRGICRFTPGAAAPPSSFPFGSQWAPICEATRRLDGLTVRRLLGDRLHRIATPSRGRVELAQLRLTAHEARAASLFDGRASPAAVAAARPADAETVLRTALLLGDTELLAFGLVTTTPEATAPPAPRTPAAPLRPPPAAPAQPPKATAAPRTVPQATSGAPAPRPPAAAAADPALAGADSPFTTGPSAPAADLAQLEAFHARLADADHFVALGLQRDATTSQVKAAYFDLARRYHPDSGHPGEEARARQLRADIFARVGEAYRALGDDAARTAYREQLEAGTVGDDVDVSAILHAEEVFRTATALVRSRQYPKALAALEEAIQLNRDEPEFAVWMAWVQFLLARDREPQYRASVAAIESALKQVPRCMAGYLFLGQMAKLMGDVSTAERHLNRGLALDPDHVELARERKFLRK